KVVARRRFVRKFACSFLPLRRAARWLQAEFGWSKSTAYNFIHIYDRMRSDVQRVGHQLPLRALCLLSAPSTPDSDLAEVVEPVEAEEKRSITEVNHQDATRRWPPTGEVLKKAQ